MHISFIDLLELLFEPGKHSRFYGHKFPSQITGLLHNRMTSFFFWICFLTMQAWGTNTSMENQSWLESIGVATWTWWSLQISFKLKTLYDSMSASLFRSFLHFFHTTYSPISPHFFRLKDSSCTNHSIALFTLGTLP